MNFNGINGDRRDAIFRILRPEPRRRCSAQEIADWIWAADPTVVPQHGRKETIQKVLREMENRGEVRRRRISHTDWWGLPR